VDPALDQPEHYWTWRLADLGFSLPQIERTRRLSLPEVVEHLLKSLEEGRPLDANRVFPVWLRKKLDLDQFVPDTVEPVAARCLQLYQKCLASDARQS
jgi:hypothetical protein